MIIGHTKELVVSYEVSVIYQVHPSEKYIPIVILPYQYLIYRLIFHGSHFPWNMPLQW